MLECLPKTKVRRFLLKVTVQLCTTVLLPLYCNKFKATYIKCMQEDLPQKTALAAYVPDRTELNLSCSKTCQCSILVPLEISNIDWRVLFSAILKASQHQIQNQSATEGSTKALMALFSPRTGQWPWRAVTPFLIQGSTATTHLSL